MIEKNSTTEKEFICSSCEKKYTLEGYINSKEHFVLRLHKHNREIGNRYYCRGCLDEQVKQARERHEHWLKEQEKDRNKREIEELIVKSKYYFKVIYKDSKEETIIGIDYYNYVKCFFNIVSLEGNTYAFNTYNIAKWESNIPDILALFKYVKSY